MEKRFQLKDVKCSCGKLWSPNTDMKYYVTCPDCHRPVSIAHLTGVERLDL